MERGSANASDATSDPFSRKAAPMKRTASLFTRVIALAAVCCSLVFASAALTACGPDHEQAIRDALTQELDTIKNLDEGFINEVASLQVRTRSRPSRSSVSIPTSSSNPTCPASTTPSAT